MNDFTRRAHSTVTVSPFSCLRRHVRDASTTHNSTNSRTWFNNLCCRMHQVPEFMLPRSPRNFKVNLGGAGVTLAPPITVLIPGPVPIICAEYVLPTAPSPRICAATQPEKFKFYAGGAGVKLAQPTQPIGTGQAPSQSPEFVLSIPLGPRICAAPQSS